jgi:hypothetical protein
MENLSKILTRKSVLVIEVRAIWGNFGEPVSTSW